MRFLFVVISFIFLALPSMAMRGGERTNGQYKEVVAIQWDKAGDEPQKCSAVIVSPTLLLTAAHCVYGLSVHKKLTINQWRQSNSGSDFSIEQVGVHDLYNHKDERENVFWDIGFIELRNVNLIERFNISELPIISTEKIQSRIMVTIVGFGMTQMRARRTRSSNVEPKRFQQLRVVNRSKDMFLLQTTRKNGPCPGDSGGAAFYEEGGKRILIGIMAMIEKRCQVESGYAGIHDISQSLDWLSQKINISF